VDKDALKEDKWSLVAPMKDKRQYLSSFALNDNKIDAFGGFFG